MPVTEHLDVGTWGLFCGNAGRQIVRIGHTPCGPVSARKLTRRVPRELLLDENRLADAYIHAAPVQETVTRDDGQWTVVLEPLVSPYSQTVIGVQAVVVPAGRPVPHKPLVGMWEWVIDRQENGQPGTNRVSYWDENLFEIYDMDTSVAQRHEGKWKAGEWSNQLIEPTDQMRVATSIREGIQDGLEGMVEKVRCLTYNVITGYGTAQHGRKHLRLVGVIPRIDPDDEFIFLQGFSYEVPETFHDMAFEQDSTAARVDDVLRGVMELASDSMVVIDTETLNVLMTSAAWRQRWFGSVDSLAELAVENMAELRFAVQDAAQNPSARHHLAARWRGSDGEVVDCPITVLGVQSGQRSNSAVIRLDYELSGAAPEVTDAGETSPERS